jgi:hypothetical protein
VGVKVTVIEQFAPTARLAPQELTWEKSPLAVILAIFRAAVPELVSVALCVGELVQRFWLEKIRLPVERLTPGCIPVPLNTTLCGLSGALSVMVSVPVRVPMAVGVNFTLIVQFAPAARLLPHVFVWEKLPLATMLVMVKALPPEFVRVMACALELEPTIWLVKVKAVVERPTPAPPPVPLRTTVWGLPDALSVIDRVPGRLPATVGVNVTLIVQLAPEATLEPQVFVWA